MAAHFSHPVKDFFRLIEIFLLNLMALLPVTVISDGQILAENLPKLGKNRAWVDDVLRDYACRAKDVYLLSCEPGGKLYFCRKERG